jgi:hypothetical protein
MADENPYVNYNEVGNNDAKSPPVKRTKKTMQSEEKQLEMTEYANTPQLQMVTEQANRPKPPDRSGQKRKSNLNQPDANTKKPALAQKPNVTSKGTKPTGYIVSLDIGSTYFGYGFADARDPYNVVMNKNWGSGFQANKAPSVICVSGKKGDKKR